MRLLLRAQMREHWHSVAGGAVEPPPTPPLEVCNAQEPAPRHPPVPRVSWSIWRAYSALGPCDVSQRIRLGSSHLRAPTIPATSALSPRTPTNSPGWLLRARRRQQRLAIAAARTVASSAVAPPMCPAAQPAAVRRKAMRAEF